MKGRHEGQAKMKNVEEETKLQVIAIPSFALSSHLFLFQLQECAQISPSPVEMASV